MWPAATFPLATRVFLLYKLGPGSLVILLSFLNQFLKVACGHVFLTTTVVLLRELASVSLAMISLLNYFSIGRDLFPNGYGPSVL